MSYYYNNYGRQSPLKRAKGLGSAKSGSDHFWKLKMTQLGLVPLSLWLAANIICMAGRHSAYEAVIDWIQQPVNTVLLLLFLVLAFYHAAIGGQEVIIDYVKDKWLKYGGLFLYYVFCAAMAAISLYSVLHIAFRMN